VADIFEEEGENSAVCANVRNPITPTGIAVDNLPYIALFGVALVVLASFGAVKLRKRAKQN